MPISWSNGIMLVMHAGRSSLMMCIVHSAHACRFSLLMRMECPAIQTMPAYGGPSGVPSRLAKGKVQACSCATSEQPMLSRMHMMYISLCWMVQMGLQGQQPCPHTHVGTPRHCIMCATMRHAPCVPPCIMHHVCHHAGSTSKGKAVLYPRSSVW